MIDIYTRLLVKYRIPLIAIFLIAAVFMATKAPSLSKVGTTDQATFLPSKAESAKARQLIKKEFPDEQAASSGVVVVHRNGGLTKADERYIAKITNTLSGPDKPSGISAVISSANKPELSNRFISKDHSTALVQINLSNSALDERSQKAVDSVRTIAERGKPASLEVSITGQAGILTDYMRTINSSFEVTAIVSIILIVVLLLLIYRSPVAMGISLISIVVSLLISRGLLGFLPSIGWKVSSLVDVFAVVFVFGTGTDYCLFLISRYKEELKGADAGAALRSAVRKVGHVIMASAGTVIVGLSSMAIADFGMLKTMGPALAMTVFVTLIVSLSFTASLMSLLGKRCFWPTSISDRNNVSGFWEKVAGVTTKYPYLVTVLIVVVLGAFYLQLPNVKTSFDTLKELPASTDSVKGFDLAQKGFEKGDITPLTMLTPVNGDALSPSSLKELSRADRVVANLSGIGEESSLVHPDGFKSESPLLVKSQLRSVSNTVLKANKGASLQQQSSSQLKPLGRYLSALAVAYPRVKNEASFRRIESVLQRADRSATPGQTNLTPAQAQQFAAQKSAMMMQLGQDVKLLGATFGDEDYLYPSALKDMYPQLPKLERNFLSKDKTTLKTVLVLKDDPYSPKAFESVSEIRSRVRGLDSRDDAFSFNKTILGGPTAELADVQTAMNKDNIRIGVLTIVGILVILAVLLRSVIAPLYLVATVILSYGTTFGISTLVFQKLLGQNGISFFIPIMLLAILVALGADYNIFLMSRIKEEAKGGDTLAGIRKASAATGGVITSAGIILAGTFAALIFSPLQSFFQVGLAVAVGITIDTFIVRAVLVPAIASIFGELNWWPFAGKVTKKEGVVGAG